MIRERGSMEMLEEGAHLLRAAPLGTVLLYLIGAIPFSLALLFFLADMTHSPFAAEHLASSSLVLAALYIWKNVWQAVFAAKLYEIVSPGGGRWGSLWRLILLQSALQPLGLLLMLPFPWVVAFFRNAALFAALGRADALRLARKQAVLSTRQNCGVLAIVALGALLLFANVVIAIALLPQLARSFLGIEGDLARMGIHILNLATMAVAAALTWMAADPLLDAVYVLRCFYGESIATGEDLRAAFRRAVALVLLVLVLITAAPPASAQQRGPDSAAPAIDAGELDRAIGEVIHRREFTWRVPRPAGEDPQGRWVGWVRSAYDLAADLWDLIVKTIRDWLRQKPGADVGGKDAPVTRRMLELLIVLVVALAVGAAVLFFRRPAPVVKAAAVTAAAPAVDLADESLTADQLPESSWRKLAEEWLSKGDCRLALRALYLAGLNYLGERGVVSIRRWKSGLDYRREVERRTRATPELAPVFTRNVAIFERGWYGRHAVDRETVEAFAAGLMEMKTYAERP